MLHLLCHSKQPFHSALSGRLRRVWRALRSGTRWCQSFPHINLPLIITLSTHTALHSTPKISPTPAALLNVLLWEHIVSNVQTDRPGEAQEGLSLWEKSLSLQSLPFFTDEVNNPLYTAYWLPKHCEQLSTNNFFFSGCPGFSLAGTSLTGKKIQANTLNRQSLVM